MIFTVIYVRNGENVNVNIKMLKKWKIKMYIFILPFTKLYVRYKREESEDMRRQVAYKQGYKMVICGKFYEVSDTKRVLHYGNLTYNPTFDEVWEMIVEMQCHGENDKSYRRKPYIRTRRTDRWREERKPQGSSVSDSLSA